MRLRDPDDRGGAHRANRSKRPPQPTRADKTAPARRSGDDHREPSRVRRGDSVRGDEARVEGHRHRRRSEALDRDAEGTESNPASSREQVGRASRASRSVTDEAPRFGSADAAERYGQTHDDFRGDEVQRYRNRPIPDPQSDEADPPELVDDPLREEQESNLEEPPTAVSGPLPPPPDLSGLTPTSRREADGIEIAEFQGEDNLTYQRVTAPDGEVTTSYTRDGVEYRNVTRADGGTSQVAAELGEDGVSHTRTVELGAEGEFEGDTTVSTHSRTDPRTGERTSQSRTVSMDPSLVRTTTEEVSRPGGEGRSTRTLTEFPDQSSDEVYSFEGDDGTFQRTTNTAPSGTSTTMTERNYTSTVPIERLADGAPAYPEAQGYEGQQLPKQVVPLPAGQRSPTEVREVELSTTDASGHRTVQHQESSWTQSSTDVEPLGDTFPSGVEAAGGTATRTYSQGSTRDENGDLVDFSTGSQTVEVEGRRRSNGEPLRTSLTESWNDRGETATTYEMEGYTRSEQPGSSAGTDAARYANPVRVGETEIFASPWTADKDPEIHLSEKGGKLTRGRGEGGEVVDFLAAGDDDVLNVSGTVTRDANRVVTSDLVTWENLDPSGDGQTVTRDRVGEDTSWKYTDITNDGKDYDRQTVVEGSPVSVYETHRDLGGGEYQTSSETTNGTETVGSSEASRSSVDRERLNLYVHHGELTSQQRDAILAEGPPYFVEHARNSEAIDGEPRRDFSSTTFAAGSGYSVGHSQYDEVDEETGAARRTSMTSTSDPDSATPYTASLKEEVRDAGSDRYRVGEEGALVLDSQGRLTFDGEVVSRSETGQFTHGAEAQAGLGPWDAVSYVGGVANSLAAHRGSEVPNKPNGVSLSKDGPGTHFEPDADLTKLAKFADIVGAVGGAAQIWSGLQDGELYTVATGVGNSSAAVGHGVSALSQSTRALSAAKWLGRLGPGVSIGLGARDAFTADSGYDRAAGVITMGAGVAALLPGPGTAVSAVLSVTAALVGAGDNNNTAEMDPRLQES